MSEYYDNNGMNQENVSPVTPFSAGSSSSFYAPPQGNGAPKKQRKKGAGKIVALALCCSLVGGAVGAGGVYAATRLTGTNATPASAAATILEGERESSVISVAQIDTSKVMTPAEVYAANVNSTVGITTSITTNWWGYQTTSAASGSGFILTEDGYILTNYHVIEGSSSITVTLYDDTSYEATLVGYDESNDIAVLKVDATGLAPVVLGDSDDLNVGDTVVAIGNPLGELTFSLTQGAVSALNRQVTLSSDLTMDLIQTDCAINSGNSGGALFNLYGEVIGITNAKYSSSSSSEASIDNIGFAIPINSVRGIVQSIIEKGYISKPYIGVSVKAVTEDMQRYGLPQGAAVETVTEGSPAEAAGLQVSDIITKVGDTEITSSNDLVDIITAADTGDKLPLTVYRQGETLTLTVEVGEQIQSALEEDDAQSSSDSSQQQQQQSSTFPWGNFGFGFGY
jgi:serine protease Do